VHERVAHQVADHLAQPGLVAQHQQGGARSDGQVDAAFGRYDASIVHGIGSQGEQVDGPVLKRALLVQPGEQQHVFHQHAHPGRFLLDSAHDPVQVSRSERTGPAVGLIRSGARGGGARGGRTTRGQGRGRSGGVLRSAALRR
jgi:hypothetical protein